MKGHLFSTALDCLFNIAATFRMWGGGAAGGSVVGRSWVRFLMRSLDFSIDLILRAALWLWSRLGLVTEMSTRNLPRDKGRPARKADITAICEPIVYEMWELRSLTALPFVLPYLEPLCDKRDEQNYFVIGERLTSRHATDVRRVQDSRHKTTGV
jgi:hypothetical protein